MLHFFRSSQATSTRFSSSREKMQAQPGAVASETIRLDVAKLGDLRKGTTSAIHSIAGLKWYIETVLVDQFSWSAGRRDLIVYVYCNSDSGDWSCETFIRPSMTVHEKKPDNVTLFTNSLLRHVWLDICNPVNVPFFRKEWGVVIEATVTIKNVIGVQMTTLSDFTTPQNDISNVALVIGDERLYVCKELLAVYSPVFRAMFFAEFDEKDKTEIPLGDVDVDEFLEFLHVIYPSRKPVTDATIDCLLSLGDRFNAEVVMRECEVFLCGPAYSNLPLEKKLLYADRFGLSRLQVLCFDSITTFNQAKMLRGKKEFGELSDKMRSSLLERILMLG